jgi:hypothetical protein
MKWENIDSQVWEWTSDIMLIYIRKMIYFSSNTASGNRGRKEKALKYELLGCNLVIRVYHWRL